PTEINDLPPGSFSFAVEASVAEEFDEDVLEDEYDGIPELLV
ncbi:unnamed protein product, partial [Rotaria magnacalcarata]